VIAFMKQAENLDELIARSLGIALIHQENQPSAYLVPLSGMQASDSAIVECLNRWRAEHQYAYPSRFTPTEAGTARWIQAAVLENDDRLLFLLTDPLLRPLGHLGLLLLPDGDVEVDNILRGEPQIKGIMSAAMQVLEKWALDHLDAQDVQLKVLASNVRAVTFYENLGYEVIERLPMKWQVEEDSRTLIDTHEEPDEVFLLMTKSVQDSLAAEEKILTAGPLISAREAAMSLDATRNGWNSSHSKYLTRFEQEFAEYIGVEFAMATSSCTGALHLALLAARVGPGDEVIVPESTWVATGAAIAYTGATPVFVDVDPDSWTLSIPALRSAITERTKAILPVHLYGYAANMTAVMEIAREHHLRVIEDAAPAIGTLIDGVPAGGFGDFGCFSFQGAKLLVTGEGGMLVTNDRELFDRAWKQQDHGRRPGSFWIDELGRKYKMSNLTAALGLGQLQGAENQIAKKRRVRDWYEEFLLDTPGVRLQAELDSTRSICWMTSVLIDEEAGKSASELAEHLSRQGIDSRPVFPPMSQFPIWAKVVAPGPNAEHIGKSALNLPSGVNLSKASVRRIAHEIARFVSE
jgi:perosamine synthetase